MDAELSWTDYYMEFADRIRSFRNDRKGLVELIYDVFSDSGVKPPTLEANKEIPTDIDPFTVFGLFNKGIKDSTRISLASSFSKRLSLKAAVPKRFDGVPVLNNQSATFYRFINERGEHDIDKLWDAFEAALDYADSGSESDRRAFIERFDIARELKGIKWNLTMGLFWVRPEFYLNLDGRSRWYLFKSDEWPEMDVEDPGDDLVSAEGYLAILDTCKALLKDGETGCNTLPELSYAAWSRANEVNLLRKGSDGETERSTEYSPDGDSSSVGYWIYSPGSNANKWDEFRERGIMALNARGIGDLSQYGSMKEMQEVMQRHPHNNLKFNKIAGETWNFYHKMRVGDVVFVKRGVGTIIGRGIVESDCEYDESYGDYGNIRRVRWTHSGTWVHPGHATTKFLADLSPYPEYVAQLNALFDISDAPEPQTYTKARFLEQVFMDEGEYDLMVNHLKRKGNIILQGAPGVGKTYMAKRMAYSMMGVKDQSRVMMVQFHQSYSYEDFIMGYRPTKDGFELRAGPFYNFCRKAANDPDNMYFFIIDEINRGNLGKIFGELFMLIEKDKRGTELPLLYSEEPFSIPDNLFIIGTMNTADRSLALMDYALRRRFSFFDIPPAFERPSFEAYCDLKDNVGYSRLVGEIRNLNSEIGRDPSLGRGFRIGHSYLCTDDNVDDEWLRSVIIYDIVPLLEEYWFDDQARVDKWRRRLLGAVE